MSSSKNLCKLLGIRYPVLLAPMAGATNPAMVAGVSNAGGLGGLGAAHMSPAQLRETIRLIREKTEGPFHVNLFSSSSLSGDVSNVRTSRVYAKLEQLHDELGLGPVPEVAPVFGPTKERLAVLVEMRVPVISFHFGVSREEVLEARSAGAKVLSTATTVAEAVALQERGVDAIIAQGSEAGGHRGTHSPAEDPRIGTMDLVVEVTQAVAVPVIASGGVMNAQGIAKSLDLGAAGVQMGTAFLGCNESPISPLWRRELRHATAESTTLTRAFSGRMARGLANRFSRKMSIADTEWLAFPAQLSLSRVIHAKARAREDRDLSAIWAGQGVGLLQECSIEELMDQFTRSLPSASE